MQQILTFFKSNKYAVIWTACYLFATWAILYFMFDFSIFNAAQWRHLARAELHGFAGFVFGILILSALPLYIATTTLIVRTKKPLITINLPKIKLPKIFSAKTVSDTQPTDTTPTTPESNEPTLELLPAELPLELRTAFLRARQNLGRVQTSAFNTMSHTNPPESDINPVTEISDTLPLPTDFDITVDTPNDNDFDIPTFTDISFDSPSDDTTISNKLTQHLSEIGCDFVIDDDIVRTPTHAIITHCDTDFWVADNDNWFAAGKTRPSPINTVCKYAKEHNVIPTIYLESDNIMNLDELRTEWCDAGILVITSPDEL